MARYIDADALLQALLEAGSAAFAEEMYGAASGLRIAEDIVRDAPTCPVLTLDEYKQAEVAHAFAKQAADLAATMAGRRTSDEVD